MNVQQLETFYWIVRLGGFTAAADRLKTTQSTVSMRIRELERSLDVRLFDRRKRTARLTPAARELVPYAEEMLRLSAQIREHMSSAATITGLLRLGVAEVISVTWLPRLVAEIHRRYPKIKLELDEALTQELVGRLRQGSLDLVLAPGRVGGAGFTSISLGSLVFAWAASPSLSLPKRALTPRDLQSLPIIALSRESHHHASIEAWFHAAGATCRRMDTCKSVGVAASLAAAGLGITLLPVRCYRNEIAARRLRIVKTAPPMRPVEFTAAYASDNLQPIVRAIADLAAEVSDFTST
jgi:DNA-binding transcriptional LysR family regulator